MRFEFFRIPVHDAGDSAEALDRFLGEVRLLSVDHQFLADGAASGHLLRAAPNVSKARRPAPDQAHR